MAALAGGPEEAAGSAGATALAADNGPKEEIKEEATEFALSLDRSSGDPLGVDVESGQRACGWDGRTLLIKGVRADGLVPRWNAENPSLAVLAGDRFVEVNGFHGDASRLIQECAKPRRLSIRVARAARAMGPGQPPSAAAASSAAPMHARADEAAAVSLRLARGPRLASDAVTAGLRREFAAARSATEAMETLRRATGRGWGLSWAAYGLLSIVRKSTARTRAEWACDQTVELVAQGLRHDLAMEAALNAAQAGDVLVALDALRRLGLQALEEQRRPLERAAAALAAGGWDCEGEVLARLAWLAAPLRLECLAPALQAAWKRCAGLGVEELALLVAATVRTASALFRVRDSRRLLEGGSVLAKVLALPAEFKLSFDITPNDSLKEWSRVLWIAAEAEAPEGEARWPAFYLAPGTTRLLLAFGPARECSEDCWTPQPGLPVGQASRVHVRVSKGAYELYVNGKHVRSATATPPGGGGRVSVHSGGGREVPAADASLANVVCRPLQGGVGLDGLLLQKVVRRLSASAPYAALPAAELVELAEGLVELDAGDEKVMRLLGQEILQRRPELTPGESWRAKVTFQLRGLPLGAVWTAVGASRKRKGGELLTTQAFAPQKSHEKKQKAQHDVEKVEVEELVKSVGDLVRTSY